MGNIFSNFDPSEGAPGDQINLRAELLGAMRVENTNGRRIELYNAQTIHPYLKNRKQFELVPIFYQRNP